MENPTVPLIPQNLLAQFDQIARAYPGGIEAGDLISKSDKAALADMDLVWPKYGGTFRLTPLGYEAARNIGYAPDLPALPEIPTPRPEERIATMIAEFYGRATVSELLTCAALREAAHAVLVTAREREKAKDAIHEAEILYREHVIGMDYERRSEERERAVRLESKPVLGESVFVEVREEGSSRVMIPLQRMVFRHLPRSGDLIRVPVIGPKLDLEARVIEVLHLEGCADSPMGTHVLAEGVA